MYQGKEFLKIINNGIVKKTANTDVLHEIYEHQKSIKTYLEPTALIDEVKEVLNQLVLKDKSYIKRITKYSFTKK